MPWFYTHLGQQLGPLSDEEFSSLVDRGVITPETLVWRDGMAQWLPHSAVSDAPAPPQLVSDRALCASCARPFPRSELLNFEQSFVCAECKPAFFQRVFEGVGANPIAAWRSGAFLITRKGARLPDRCLRCNRASNGRTILKRFQWQPGWVYAPFALIPLAFIAVGVISVFSGGIGKSLPNWFKQSLGLGIIALMIAAAVISAFAQQRADVYMPLCARHFRSHYITTAAVVCGWIVGGAALFIGLTMMTKTQFGAWFAFGIIIVGSFAAVFTTRRMRILSVKRMTKEHVWLRGASKEFLAELPEWDGRA